MIIFNSHRKEVKKDLHLAIEFGQVNTFLKFLPGLMTITSILAVFKVPDVTPTTTQKLELIDCSRISSKDEALKESLVVSGKNSKFSVLRSGRLNPSVAT